MAENNIEFELTVEEKQALSAIRKVTKSIDKFGDESEKSFKQSSRAFDVFKGTVGAFAAVNIFSGITRGARSLFNTFITEGVKASQVQEDAINSLNIALKASGQFTQEASQDFQAFASALQEQTKFGDEAILTNAALIQSIGQLSQEGLKEATAAAVDLSAALGVDLNTAARLVGRAATGEVSSLTRYGLVVERGATQAESFANALEAINEKFGGAAAGQVKTFSGASTQLSNTFGDLQEVTGDIITQNPAFIGAINALNTVFLQLQKVVKDNQGTIREFIGNFASETVLGAINFVGSAIINVSSAFTTLQNVTNAFVASFNDAVALFLTGAIKLQEAGIAIKSALNLDTTEQQATLEGLKQLRGEYERTSEFAKNEAAERIANQERFTAKVQETTNKIKQFANDQIEAAKNITVAETEESNKRVGAKQAELSAIQLLEAERKLAQTEEKELQKVEKQVEDDENFLFLQERLGREEALRVTSRAQQLENEKKHNEALKVLRDARVKAEQQSIFLVRKFEDQSQKERIQNLQGTLGTISTLTGSSNSKLFNIGKAAALANHAVNVPAAISKALSSAPPPFNFALAALVGTAMAVQGARIAAQRPPAFQDGGIVPGSSFSGDNVLARVNSGELILNRAQQNSVAAQMLGNEGLMGEIQALRQDLSEQPVIVQVDGFEIARAVRNSQQDGFNLA